MTALFVENGSLVLMCGYSAGLVAELKARIPYTERKFEPTRRAWVVAPQHGQFLSTLVERYLGEIVMVPQVAAGKPREDTQILDIRYVGITKPRDGYTEPVAFGWNAGDWRVIFPESVLTEWFTGVKNTQAAAQATTLYGVLGVSQTVSDDEIKSAFRRMARQWHPDVCREPNAKEQFIKIKDAYEILSTRRARYDAGLALEASIKKETIDPLSIFRGISAGYRAPLRCGYVLALGTEQVGRFIVKQILGWEDITDAQGRTLVTSYPVGASHFVEAWS